jgi:hypothetical protein
MRGMQGWSLQSRIAENLESMPGKLLRRAETHYRNVIKILSSPPRNLHGYGIMAGLGL